jgi:hypothetical protein
LKSGAGEPMAKGGYFKSAAAAQMQETISKPTIQKPRIMDF